MRFRKSPEQKAAKKVLACIKKYKTDYSAFLATDTDLPNKFRKNMMHEHIVGNIERGCNKIMRGVGHLDDDVRGVGGYCRAVISGMFGFIQKVKGFMLSKRDDKISEKGQILISRLNALSPLLKDLAEETGY